MGTIEEIPGDSHIFYSDSEVAQLQHAIHSPGLFVKNIFEPVKSPDLAPLLAEFRTEARANYHVQHHPRCRKLGHPWKAMSHANLEATKQMGIHDADGPAIVLFQKMEWTQPSWLQNPVVSSTTSATDNISESEFFIPSHWKMGLKRAIQLKVPKIKRRSIGQQRPRLTFFHSSRGESASSAVLSKQKSPSQDSTTLFLPASAGGVSGDASGEMSESDESMPTMATFVYQPVLDSTLSEELYLEHPVQMSSEMLHVQGSQTLVCPPSVEINIMDDSPVSSVASQASSKKPKRGGRRLPTLLLNQPLSVIESGVEHLSEMELGFCSRLKLDPRIYVNSKETMIRTAEKKGLFKKTAAQKMFRMDVNKTGKIYDFIVSKGWMERPP